MFIELVEPTVVDVYRGVGMSKLRLREPDMGTGRLWIGLKAKDDEALRKLLLSGLSLLYRPDEKAQLEQDVARLNLRKVEVRE